MINFFKYQGAGNDFVMIDNRNQAFTGNKVQLAQRLCERRFGIGSDGLIFIEPTSSPLAYDFEMDFLNPDGSRSFCGNGSRCAVKFAQDLGIFTGNSTKFKAIDGIHLAEVLNSEVKIEMKPVEKVEIKDKDFFIHTGSPHYVCHHQNIDQLDMVKFGRNIRYSDTYKKEGTNVNVVEEIQPNHIKVRTYERGVEYETLACGTGVTACAISYAYKNSIDQGQLKIEALGGQLSVEFNQYEPGKFKDLFLIGPAQFVFKGTYDL